jgi:hypothetical protein
MLEVSILPANGQLVVGLGVETYSPADDWGGGALYNGGYGTEVACRWLEQGMPGRHNFIFTGFGGYTWTSTFNVCLESAGE